MGKIKGFFNTFRLFQNWASLTLFKMNILTSNEFLGILRGGHKFFIQKNSFDLGIIQEIYGEDVYKTKKLNLNEEDLVIDIGANIGVFSIKLALEKGVKVYSYEPFRNNFNQLLKNISLNNCSSNIFPFNLGVGKKRGTKILYLSKNSAMHSIFCQKNSKQFKMNVISLKDIFSQNNIKICHLLKIDCEGAEFEILYGCPKEVYRKIKRICLEVHESIASQKKSDLIKFLIKLGFECNIDPKNPNILFVKNKNLP